MSEENLIIYCSPTLAGIKTGSLFTCQCSCPDSFYKAVWNLNRRLIPKGIRILPLRFSRGKVLIYVYRPSGLQRDLSEARAQQLLENHGYCPGNCQTCLAQLARKLRQNEEFPHEIGLFLGYPAEDVAGFIDNKALNCKCVGTWKVYGDEISARKRFEQYKKCSAVYTQCWKRGFPLERLTITR